MDVKWVEQAMAKTRSLIAYENLMLEVSRESVGGQGKNDGCIFARGRELEIENAEWEAVETAGFPGGAGHRGKASVLMRCARLR